MTTQYKTEIFKNDDGFYRVKIYGYMDSSGQGRWLLDSDLMTLMSSSHRSKELTFGSVDGANRAIADFYRVHSSIQTLFKKDKQDTPKYSDTWKPIDFDPEPKLTSRTDKDGHYVFENVNEVLKWAIRKIKR